MRTNFAQKNAPGFGSTFGIYFTEMKCWANPKSLARPAMIGIMGTKLTPLKWDIICFAEQYWRANKCFPSFGEFAAEFNMTQHEAMGELRDETIRKHLAARGIDWDQETPTETSANSRRTGRAKRLSDIQVAAVSTILNPADRRSVNSKLESLGIPASTYQGWKKSKLFMDYMTQQGEELFGENMPEVHNALTTRAIEGDTRAIKQLYEVSGRYRPGQNDNLNNVKMMIIKLVEVVQSHVTDPEVLQKIAADFHRITENEMSGVETQNISKGTPSIVANATGSKIQQNQHNKARTVIRSEIGDYT